MTDVIIPYAPRALQRAIHQSLARFSVVVCHRRFGKTVLAVNQLLRDALRCTRERPRFAYIAPLYRQAKQAAWDYLKHYAKPVPGVRVNEGELRVDLPNGARVQLFGADNPDALRGMYLDGAVLDEYAQMLPRLWSEVVRPMLADREGWALFIGTPRGRNAFCELYETAKASPDWFAALYRASETGIIAKGELDAMRQQMDEAEYAQELECSFSAAIAGAYYGALMEATEREGRIASVPVDPHALVHTAWDLGIGDSTAIWFAQQVGREVHLVDYLEQSGVGLDWYVRELRERGYLYGEHLLPHDAQARELGTGKTRVETLRALGIEPRIVPLQEVADGINAVRGLLPRCWFDARRCERGVEALRQYRREWDEKGGMFRARPTHDWTSHAADAFRYLATGIREQQAKDRPAPKPQARQHAVDGGWMAA